MLLPIICLLSVCIVMPLAGSEKFGSGFVSTVNPETIVLSACTEMPLLQSLPR